MHLYVFNIQIHIQIIKIRVKNITLNTNKFISVIVLQNHCIHLMLLLFQVHKNPFSDK